MAVKKGGGKKFLSVDFTGVESGGKAVPDGFYEVDIAEITEEESSDSGNPYLKFKFRINEGDCKGAPLYDNLSLQPQALWKLKGLLEVLGEDVPDSVMKLDISEYIGASLAVTVVNETYQGKDRPKVDSYAPAGATSGKSSKADDNEEEESEEGEEEEASSKTNGTGGTKKKTKSKASEFEEGQKVKFTDDEGVVQKGKVVSVDGDTATVDVKGTEWELETSDLTAV